MRMVVKLTLALPEGLEVTGMEIIDDVLTITAISTHINPCCPLCGIPAARGIAVTPAKSLTCLVAVNRYGCYCKSVNTFVM